MSGNGLHDDSAKVIADLLNEENSTITQLDISKNKIT